MCNSGQLFLRLFSFISWHKPDSYAAGMRKFSVELAWQLLYDLIA